MTPDSPVTALASLTMSRLLTWRDDSSRVERMSCEVSLDLHQPDLASHDRLLGICAGRQHALILGPVGEEAVMVRIPEAEFFTDLGGYPHDCEDR